VRTFTLDLRAATQGEVIEDVTVFAGRDASGSFGLMAGHGRLMTTLVFGLARYQTTGAAAQYLAVPGAVLYFEDNHLLLCTRRYVRDSDYRRVTEALERQLLDEERTLLNVKDSLRSLEHAMLKRIWAVRYPQEYG